MQMFTRSVHGEISLWSDLMIRVDGDVIRPVERNDVVVPVHNNHRFSKGGISSAHGLHRTSL